MSSRLSPSIFVLLLQVAWASSSQASLCCAPLVPPLVRMLLVMHHDLGVMFVLRVGEILCALALFASRSCAGRPTPALKNKRMHTLPPHTIRHHLRVPRGVGPQPQLSSHRVGTTTNRININVKQ